MRNYSCNYCHKIWIPSIDFGNFPIPNHFLQDRSIQENTYPLEFGQCASCGLVQINKIDCQIFQEDYPYRSSVNLSYIEQCKTILDPGTSKDLKILEIGCNDGYLLKYLKEQGFKNLYGCEPIKALAYFAGNYATVFDQGFEDIDIQQYDIIIANNVIGHVPDLGIFMDKLRESVNLGSIVIIEMPDFKTMYDECHFDVVYHEHYSYFSYTTMESIFLENGFEVAKYVKIPSHGKSIRYYFRYTGKPISTAKSLFDFYKFRDAYILSLKRCREFFAKYDTPLQLYGAAAKGIMFLNHMGLRRNEVLQCIDDTHSKQNKFLPGSKISVTNIDNLKLDGDIVVTAWNFVDEIAQKLRTKGFKGKIIYRDMGEMKCHE